MTRTISSVPEGRSSTRPESPSSAETAATAAATPSSVAAHVRSTPRTFTSTCGYTVMIEASSASERPVRAISAMRCRPVSTPSPVVAYSLMITCPDCSPPSE